MNEETKAISAFSGIPEEAIYNLPNSFKESGTGVNCKAVFISKAVR